MKYLTFLIPLICISIFSCKPDSLVSEKEILGIIALNSPSPLEIINQKDLEFWGKRMELDPSRESNEIRYANTLADRFHLYGNIDDLIKANTIIEAIHLQNNGKEAGINRNLSTFSSLRHRFKESNTYCQTAFEIGENRYASELQLFDTAFELGNIATAKTLLKRLKKKYEYAYFFRLSKMYHYEGEIEKARDAMQKAVDYSYGNVALAQVALSNLADLCLHDGDFSAATQNYKNSLMLDGADFHSIAGLGVVAMYNDKNLKLAKQLFEYVKSRSQSPDIYLKLLHYAQEIGDKNLEKKYAIEFSDKVKNPKYGDMYNKYLIELYDGILNDNKEMLKIAQKEQLNRKTPQTNCWNAWALYKNKQTQKALKIYQNEISGFPLEGLELYFMGKMMFAEKKKYNAKNYFEAAYKNKFDLDPSKRKELETLI